MQRLFDIFFSTLALLALSPMLIPIAIILKFSGEGDIFYTQERIGAKSKSFGLLKFATMLKDSPNIGSGEITLKNDPRVLPVGKFLRKTKINELPQLINILKGEMSVVGPRPMVPKTYENYGEAGKQIYSLRPGLTGVGSIVFRDEEAFLENRNNPMDYYIKMIIPYKIDIELWYLENKSITLYFMIIFLTALTIIKPKSNLYKQLFKKLPKIPDGLTINQLKI